MPSGMNGKIVYILLSFDTVLPAAGNIQVAGYTILISGFSFLGILNMKKLFVIQIHLQESFHRLENTLGPFSCTKIDTSRVSM